jgi:4-coumarate--CoA ligase (photoactive yellow protein activation family)
MRAFAINQQQASKVIAGLIAEELGRAFARQVDYLTLAGWTGETALGPGGADLSAAERAACAQAVEAFFQLSPGRIVAIEAATIEDWSKAALAALNERMLSFSFLAEDGDPAGERISHDAAEVFKDAAAVASLLYGRRRIVALVAPQTYAGFAASILTPALLGAPAADARAMTTDELARFLAFGDAVIAGPPVWRRRLADGLRAPDNAIGVVFGEPLTAELAAAMRKAGFGSIRELCGSNSAGLIAWRDSPSEAFTLFDHWRRSGDGVERLKADGQVNPIALPERLDWSDDRSFRPGERRDGAVRIGAVHVRPQRVASVIRAHPGVSACTVEVTRADGLNRLIAHIELARGQSLNERLARDIDAWCRSQLRPAERPRIFRFETTSGEG